MHNELRIGQPCKGNVTLGAYLILYIITELTTKAILAVAQS